MNAIEIQERMAESLRLRGRSARTIKSYLFQIEHFHRFCGCRLENVEWETVRRFLLYLKDERGLSASSINQAQAALKILLCEILDKPWKALKLGYSRRPRKLPEILSRGEVAALLQAPSSLKQRTILMTLYSAGLRLSEVTHLKASHIDSGEMRIHVHGGKGNKDRYVMLSERLLSTLRQYWKSERPKIWLFPSPHNPRQPIGSRSVQRIVEKAALKAGIRKRVTPHLLRHCFATHLLESGTNLRYLQELLGHGSLQTTMIYLKVRAEHATAVTSPLDLLGV